MHEHLQPMVGELLAKYVIPSLRPTLLHAGKVLAEQRHGETADAFKVDEAQRDMLYALADFLVLSVNDHSEDEFYPVLQVHQLTPDHCRAFFLWTPPGGVELTDEQEAQIQQAIANDEANHAASLATVASERADQPAATSASAPAEAAQLLENYVSDPDAARAECVTECIIDLMSWLSDRIGDGANIIILKD